MTFVDNEWRQQKGGNQTQKKIFTFEQILTIIIIIIITIIIEGFRSVLSVQKFIGRRLHDREWKLRSERAQILQRTIENGYELQG